MTEKKERKKMNKIKILRFMFIYCDLCFQPDSCFGYYMYYNKMLLKSTCTANLYNNMLALIILLIIIDTFYFFDVSVEIFSMFQPGLNLRSEMLFTST